VTTVEYYIRNSKKTNRTCSFIDCNDFFEGILHKYRVLTYSRYEMLFEFVKKMLIFRHRSILEFVNDNCLKTVLKYKNRVIADLAESDEHLKYVQLFVFLLFYNSIKFKFYVLVISLVNLGL